MGKGRRVLHLLWTRYQMDEYQTRVKTTLDHRTTKPGSLFTNYIKSLVIDNIILSPYSSYLFQIARNAVNKKYKKIRNHWHEWLKSRRAIISSPSEGAKKAARFISSSNDERITGTWPSYQSLSFFTCLSNFHFSSRNEEKSRVVPSSRGEERSGRKIRSWPRIRSCPELFSRERAAYARSLTASLIICRSINEPSRNGTPF